MITDTGDVVLVNELQLLFGTLMGRWAVKSLDKSGLSIGDD
jgi:hypothetical protein